MAKMSKLDRAKQLMDRGKLSKADFGAVSRMNSASGLAGFGGAPDGEGDEMPAAPDEEQDEGPEGMPENVSPEMIKAGVACMRKNSGMKPAQLVAEIFQAMEQAE